MDNKENDIKEIRDTGNPIRRRSSSRIWLPVGLVAIGGLLLMRQLGMPMPEWLFSWQMILIGIGIISGLSCGFRGGGWLIMILVGTFFLMEELIPSLDIHRFIWPAAIILVGLVMLIRPKKPHWMDHDWQERWHHKEVQRWQRRRMRRGYPGDYSGVPGYPDQNASDQSGQSAYTGTSNHWGSGSKGFSSEDYMDATSILGGIHKNILSKDFKGGDITIFMGGAELNLSQADIQGTASLDITQIMGGTKIIVPPHWEIRSQLTSIFGNIEDKRTNIGNTDPTKVLIIDGTSIFGGIEIRNY